MNKLIIDQSYLSVGLFDQVDARVVPSMIKNILYVAEKYGLKNYKKSTVLDAGCGDATFSIAIEKYVKKVVAVEPDTTQFALAVKNKKKKKSNVRLHKTLIENFSTKERFDLVLSLTVLEHMPDARVSFAHIFDLMPSGGLIYLTVPNRLWPYEYHYQLWFLSWLPLPLANLYLRLSGHGNSFEDSSYMPTYFGLCNFFNQFPCTYKFIPPEPNAAYLGWGLPTSGLYSLIQAFGIKLLHFHEIFWIFSKTFILVIKKK